jgi:hypothetical protein
MINTPDVRPLLGVFALSVITDIHLTKTRHLVAKVKRKSLRLQFGADADVYLVHAADNVAAIAGADLPFLNPMHGVDEKLTQLL